ncbi:uncharacterized protein LOC106770740 [Vigna radiata var. radiata]|uniref:Uncharacterized protein LOC106770740 n=1 Tax=Vigna radiata var. radiata TaxID=3916 RepID=A0A3Q0F9S2_VIGRR|nr:uncharacterized protein LOC106770740 [Vigna radiata var. radiata]
MASSSSKLTLKLLIDAKREKVLFAEASKTVVDFLFNLLCLPIGTVIRILKKNQMVGCLANLYQSVENLDETYMQPTLHKDILLKPSASVSSQISGLLPSVKDSYSTNSTNVFYRCPNHYGHVTCDYTTRCPDRYCGSSMNSQMTFVGEKVANEISANSSGFVKEVVTYMVMDDLIIQPMSSISSITLLNKFNVKEVGVLQEKVVELDMKQVANEISSDKGGFVKEVVTYMVMDDLVIQPMSSISSLTLLNKFNVKEVRVLQ